MPQIFRIGSYVIYFGANENQPLEPVHVHIVKGIPASNATKVWITKAGKCLLCNNNSQIPAKTLLKSAASAKRRFSGKLVNEIRILLTYRRYYVF